MANVSKYYAVKKGRKPGIYTTWEECSAQVSGFAGAVYKSFSRRQDALAFLKGAVEPPPVYSQPALLAVEPVQPAAEKEDQETGLPQVTLYTDGGAINNPGPGGYGAVLLVDGQRKELSAGFRRTTNNRMEMMAVIAGLQALSERSAVKLFSDSSYVINALRTGAARRWRQQGWQRKDGPVPNADLWEHLLQQVERHQVSLEWVPGHSGIPENERCDWLAVHAARAANLPPDPGFERSNP